MTGPETPAGKILPTVAPVEAPPRLGTVERFVDRLNPILVREVQQTLNGRAFLSTLGIALLGVVVVGLTASGRVSPGVAGYATFRLALQLLAPIVIVAVPLVAFLSMRQEVSAGTIEHLLLSRLGPGAIVRGKLYAAVVQLVLFLSVFSPLVAMTFLLRGVDVPTILQALGLTALTGLVACAFAIAMGGLSRWHAVRALPLLVTAAGLTIACVGIVGAMDGVLWEISSATAHARGAREAPSPLALAWVPSAIAVLLYGVTASAALAHPNENRSSVFRLFAFGMVSAAFCWFIWLDARFRSASGASASDMPEIAPVLAWAFAIILFPFWYFAVTEAGIFSLRVRTRVPASRGLAGLVTPWLPGGGRGYLFTVLLMFFVLAGGWFVPLWVAEREPKWRDFRSALGLWGYTMAYAGAFAFVRRRLPPSGRATAALRLLGIPAIVLVTMLPRLVDLVRDVRYRTWGPFDALDPFRTLGRVRDGADDTALWVIWGAAAVGFALALVPIVRGFAEVFDASRERRGRAR